MQDDIYNEALHNIIATVSVACTEARKAPKEFIEKTTQCIGQLHDAYGFHGPVKDDRSLKLELAATMIEVSTQSVTFAERKKTIEYANSLHYWAGKIIEHA